MQVKNPMLVAAALDSVLIAPAALFITALVLRNLPLSELANTGQRIVMWYAGKMWTLWVLLLALPLAVLLTGGVVLMREWEERPPAVRQPFAMIRAQPMSLWIAALTLSAVGILTAVVLHMLAN
ncbi:MAG: hypothetical protein JO150_01755 [Acidobacteriaceae bacterium]|nr:hypothetical protein [Acidobacteriaceae bacterium]